MRYYCTEKLTLPESISWMLTRISMRLKGYKIKNVFTPTFSNFECDGMPMNMARHNRKAGTYKVCWVKRSFHGTVVKDIPVSMDSRW